MGDERTGDAGGLEVRFWGGADLLEDLVGSEGRQEEEGVQRRKTAEPQQKKPEHTFAVDSLAASFHAKVFRQEGMTPISTPALPDEQELCSEQSVVH
ncbi:hypothetical protein HDU96_008311 [Phlyctochytrium bullatum]|nr:hypothetical protein HDU96_008311 [Phlyctochytrium bullatum]